MTEPAPFRSMLRNGSALLAEAQRVVPASRELATTYTTLLCLLMGAAGGALNLKLATDRIPVDLESREEWAGTLKVAESSIAAITRILESSGPAMAAMLPELLSCMIEVRDVLRCETSALADALAAINPTTLRLVDDPAAEIN